MLRKRILVLSVADIQCNTPYLCIHIRYIYTLNTLTNETSEQDLRVPVK